VSTIRLVAELYGSTQCAGAHDMSNRLTGRNGVEIASEHLPTTHEFDA